MYIYCVRTAIGQSIKEHRKKRNLTQNQLSEMLDVSAIYLRHLEGGRRTPSVELLYKIAHTLNMSVDCIFFPENQDTSELRTQIHRLLNKRAAHELIVLLATIEAMNDFGEQKAQ